MVTPLRQVPLLGLAFADLDAAAAAALIARYPQGARFQWVVTPNADHLVRLARQPALAPLYHEAGLRLLDSRVVARLARLLGLEVPRVAPGSDVVAILLRQHLVPAEPVTVIGLDARHLPALSRAVPGARFVHHNPPMGFDRDPQAMAATVQFVLAHPARFVMLAVGSPRQEKLAAALAQAGARGTALCIGASLEFVAGVRRRAPEWMQRAGLEWLHRLGSEPRRLARRYLVDSPAVLRLLLAERARLRRDPV
jgi:exopolysaccharide biosynthesis WecB/TagA/CpsF family protein